jgi:uncharacterized membrane protein YciS (DUF1049 family)
VEDFVTEENQDLSETADVLLAFMDVQWTQARHTEDQRATLTNFLIVIFIALQGFIVQKQFDLSTLMLAVVITLVGVFGIIASAKFYERFRLSTDRVGEIMKYLDDLYPKSKLLELHRRSDNEHKQRFPHIHKIRLHHIWYVLNVAVALFGIINLLIILVTNKII